MRTKILMVVLTILLSGAQMIQAQVTEDNKKTIEQLLKKKEVIKKEERDKLKAAVEVINERLERNEITAATAQELKETAAKKHALNIENRLAIIDNKIALYERNQEDVIIKDNEEDKEVILFGIKINSKEGKKIKYDRRTRKDLVVAFGLNNALADGQSLSDSDFKILGSRFFEIGWSWKTRVFKNSNWLRVNYGISYVSNGLKLTDNRYFVENGDLTEVEDFRVELDKSKFRMDHLVVPLYLEIGPSRIFKSEEKIRYYIDRKFRLGIGGYVGANISTRQKLKYKEDGDRIKDKIKRDYNTNDFVYGLGAYAGFGDMSLYLKYDLNPIFKDPNTELNNISLGLRFDL
ncbi:porin family protein [Aquimarina rhabdastrellae]